MWIFYEKWWVVLVMTGSPTVDIHVDNRLTRTSCPLSPCLSALFKKISTPSDKHLRHGTACFGSSAFWKAFKKPVAILLLLWWKSYQNSKIRTKKLLNQTFLYGFYDFFHFSENNLLYKPKISCFCIFSAQNSDFNTKKLASSHTV